MHDLRPPELKCRLTEPDPPPLLLDVREPWEFDICHLEGSELISMGDIPRALADGRIDRERPIAVICHHGIRSRQVALYLEHFGCRDVMNLAGGVEAWAREIDPTMPTY
jgi:rhodanese-related sulfurtransferase